MTEHDRTNLVKYTISNDFKTKLLQRYELWKFTAASDTCKKSTRTLNVGT
jgi:hypothetical protein